MSEAVLLQVTKNLLGVPVPVYAPDVFHTGIVSASGPTAVWTPATGQRFILMGYTISVAGSITGGGELEISLVDNATTFANYNCTLGATETGDSHMAADYGNGYTSLLVDNVLNINLSAALATGHVMINVWGTESY